MVSLLHLFRVGFSSLQAHLTEVLFFEVMQNWAYTRESCLSDIANPSYFFDALVPRRRRASPGASAGEFLLGRLKRAVHPLAGLLQSGTGGQGKWKAMMPRVCGNYRGRRG